MGKSNPVARPVSFTGVLLSAAGGLLAAAAGFVAAGTDPKGAVCGFVACHLIQIVARLRTNREQRRGLRHYRRSEFQEAVEAFAGSERFWERHPFLDRHRAFLLGTSSPYSNHTLARFNQASCLVQLRRGTEAMAILDRLLAEDRDNPLAAMLKTALEAGMQAARQSPLSP